MRINRSHPDKNFTISPNAMLQDERLSYVALGILVRLLSRPDGWSTNADTLWRQAKRSHGSKTGQGREAIRAAFAELEKYGYLVRRKVKGEGGQISTLMELYDTPDHRGTDFRASETRASDAWASDSPASIERTDQQSTDQESTEEKHSAALADTRAAAAAASARDEDQLHRLYTSVHKLTDTELRNALLAFEQKRPRIYRECRNAAIDQINGEDSNALKADNAGLVIDRLSFKYALKHYAPEWPAWITRSLPEPAHLKSVS
jgi:hypothetical protein